MQEESVPKNPQPERSTGYAPGSYGMDQAAYGAGRERKQAMPPVGAMARPMTPYGYPPGGMYGQWMNQYDLPMDPLKPRGEYKSSFGRDPSTKLDIQKLSQEAEELATDRDEAYKRMESIVHKAIEEGQIESRELLHAMRELSALGTETASIKREAGLYSAEAERVMKVAEITAANFKDTFVAYKPDGSVDSDASKRKVDEFIQNAMKKGLEYEDVIKAMRGAMEGYMHKEKEIRKGPRREKAKQDYLKKHGLEELPPGIIFDAGDTTVIDIISELVKVGMPIELIKDIKSQKDRKQAIRWSKGVDTDSVVNSVFQFEKILNYRDFEQSAIAEKFWDVYGDEAYPIIAQQAKKHLLRYWWDPKSAGFKPGTTEYWATTQEDILRHIASSGLPTEIKDFFRDEYIVLQDRREKFLEEFLNSGAVTYYLAVADNGGAKQDPSDPNNIKGWVGPAVDYFEGHIRGFLDKGLIGQQEYDTAWANFADALYEQVGFEGQMINFGLEVQKVIRDMIREEREVQAMRSDTDFDLDEEVVLGPDKRPITVEAVISRMDQDKRPKRDQMGGFAQMKYIEKIIQSELNREVDIDKAYNELARLKIDRPVDSEVIATKFDQMLRIPGNVLKLLLLGHGIDDMTNAIQNNIRNIYKADKYFQDEIDAYNDKIRRKEKEIAEKREVNATNLVEILTEAYGLKRGDASYAGLADVIKRTRNTQFNGLSTEYEPRDKARTLRYESSVYPENSKPKA